LVELDRREFGNRPVGCLLRMPGVYHWIVMDYNDAVACRMHIELDSIGAELDGALERGN
jgi:hypothetical protein